MSGGDGEREAILAKIKAQGDIVRKLKEQKAEKDQVGSGKAIDLLNVPFGMPSPLDERLASP